MLPPSAPNTGGKRKKRLQFLRRLSVAFSRALSGAGQPGRELVGIWDLRLAVAIGLLPLHSRDGLDDLRIRPGGFHRQLGDDDLGTPLADILGRAAGLLALLGLHLALDGGPGLEREIEVVRQAVWSCTQGLCAAREPTAKRSGLPRP